MKADKELVTLDDIYIFTDLIFKQPSWLLVYQCEHIWLKYNYTVTMHSKFEFVHVIYEKGLLLLKINLLNSHMS